MSLLKVKFMLDVFQGSLVIIFIYRNEKNDSEGKNFTNWTK